MHKIEIKFPILLDLTTVFLYSKVHKQIQRIYAEGFYNNVNSIHRKKSYIVREIIFIEEDRISTLVLLFIIVQMLS